MGDNILASRISDLEKLIKTQQKQNINILKRINNLEKRVLSGETPTEHEDRKSTSSISQGKEGEESCSKLELTLRNVKRYVKQGMGEMEDALSGKNVSKNVSTAREEKSNPS